MNCYVVFTVALRPMNLTRLPATPEALDQVERGNPCIILYYEIIQGAIFCTSYLGSCLINLTWISFCLYLAKVMRLKEKLAEAKPDHASFLETVLNLGTISLSEGFFPKFRLTIGRLACSKVFSFCLHYSHTSPEGAALLILGTKCDRDRLVCRRHQPLPLFCS